MKPDQSQVTMHGWKALFDLQFDTQKNNQYLQKAKCQSGNPCINLCTSSHCQNSAAICFDLNCSCQINHNNEKYCEMGFFHAIVKRLENKRKDLPQMLNWINFQYDALIDWISEQREKIYLKIKNYGLNEAQMTFLTAVYAGKCEELTGNQVHEVVNDLNEESKNAEQNMVIMQKYLSEIWQQSFQKIQKQVSLLNQRIFIAPLKTYQAKTEKLQSVFKLDSKVAVTETERLTVTQMLNSSCERRVSQYKLLYRASENDFQVFKFWLKCDQKTDTVALIRTEFDKVIGGYTPLSWKKEKGGGYGAFEKDQSLRSFLFSVSEKAKFTLIESENQYAIKHDISYGPTFGYGRDLIIQKNANNNHKSFADIGHSYKNSRVQYGTQEAWQFFQGSTENNYFKIKEWEVWQVMFKQ